jgi:hypothetical protein
MNGIVPTGEGLRRAVRWLSDFHRHDCAAVEDAARRFDLTPLQEEFLLRHFTVATVDARERPPSH